MEQDRNPAQSLTEIVEHGVELARAALLMERPRLALVDRAVQRRNQLPNPLERLAKAQIENTVANDHRQRREAARELRVRAAGRIRHDPVSIALQHRKRALQEIAEIVGEIAVVPLRDLLF